MRDRGALPAEDHAAQIWAGRQPDWVIAMAMLLVVLYVATVPQAAAKRGDFPHMWVGGRMVALGTPTLLYAPEAHKEASAGSYVLAATNPFGGANSSPAMLAVLAPTPGSYAASIIGNGPLGYWPLNEPFGSAPAFDWFGTSDETVEAGVMMGAFGVRPPDFRGLDVGNLAAQFDGFTPASVAIPPLNLNTNTFTFTLWLKRNGDQPTRAGIIHQRIRGSAGLATGLGFQDSPNNNQLSYNWNDDGASYTWNPGFTPPGGEWTFVAVSITPAGMTSRGISSVPQTQRFCVPRALRRRQNRPGSWKVRSVPHNRI